MNINRLRESQSATYGRFAIMFSMIFMLGVVIADQADPYGNNFGRLLIAVPLLAAVFGAWRRVFVISLVNLFLAAALGQFSAHGPNSHPSIYFFVIMIVSGIGVFAASVRELADRKLSTAIDSVARLDALEEMASTDWLTGKLNRRGVAQAIDGVEHQIQTVVMFDIDGLKKINDTYGHQTGDKFIKYLTSRISANLKVADIFGRWGGDEFVLLLPHGTAESATIVDRVIKECQASPLNIGETSIQIHLSAGIANWDENVTFDQALTHADAALYAAKHRGGSCAEIYKQDLDDEK